MLFLLFVLTYCLSQSASWQDFAPCRSQSTLLSVWFTYGAVFAERYQQTLINFCFIFFLLQKHLKVKKKQKTLTYGQIICIFFDKNLNFIGHLLNVLKALLQMIDAKDVERYYFETQTEDMHLCFKLVLRISKYIFPVKLG